jgi:hypothetical protein
MLCRGTEQAFRHADGFRNGAIMSNAAIQALSKVDATIANAISALRIAQSRIRELTHGDDSNPLRDKMACMCDGFSLQRNVLATVYDALVTDAEHYCGGDQIVAAEAREIMCDMFLDLERREQAKGV